LRLPPPLACPHLVISTSFTLLIHKYLLAVVRYVIAKGWVPDELPNALYWITDPKLIVLGEELAIFIS
jgi:hypothetical protein